MPPVFIRAVKPQKGAVIKISPPKQIDVMGHSGRICLGACGSNDVFMESVGYFIDKYCSEQMIVALQEFIDPKTMAEIISKLQLRTSERLEDCS